MLFSQTEETMWEDTRAETDVKVDDREINERYVRGEGRIVTETNREKLPGFIQLMENKNYLDLRPFYQRRPRWTVDRQSLLIESFIMNIPVPPVFLYERDFNSYEVMDGQQRITAIKDFYDNGYRLKGLEAWPELNGRRYRDLPEKVRAGIDRRSITSIVLLKESAGDDDEVAFLRQNVFERLNTGGVKLERQEIRNAIFRGPFNDLLEEITRSDLFREVWGIPRYVPGEIESNPDLLKNGLFSKMGDSEIVLRFFALRHADQYRRGMQGFLDMFAAKARVFNLEDVEFLRELYFRTLELAVGIYGARVFQPFEPVSGEWLGKPQTAFHDAVMVGLSRHLEKSATLLANAGAVVEATKALFARHEPGTFTGRGNTKADILERIALYEQAIAAVA